MKTLTWQDVGQLPSDEEMQADRDRHMAEVDARLLARAKAYSLRPDQESQNAARDILNLLLGGTAATLNPHVFADTASKGRH